MQPLGLVFDILYVSEAPTIISDSELSEPTITLSRSTPALLRVGYRFLILLGLPEVSSIQFAKLKLSL